MHARPEEGFVEVADRCFIARYRAWDTTIGAVIGSEGALVVDTRATNPHGGEIAEHVRLIAPDVPIRWVVNTHEHFDHVLGNVAFPEATIHAHEVAAASMTDAVERIREAIKADPEPDPPAVTAAVLDDVLAAELRLPDVTFASVSTIDLGDRYVELLHPGRGHTAGDLVLRVPAADVVYAGDLVEESAPPAFGSDSYPLEWAATLDIVVGLLTPSTVLVPGHGAAVGKEFVEQQRSDVSDVGVLVRSLYEQGVVLADVVAAGGSDWPFPDAVVLAAARVAYEQLAAAGAVAGSASAQRPAGSDPLPLA
jgi:glyoxylase-like metal-dependent hydrolase (beta-lactamase superfamily II)